MTELQIINAIGVSDLYNFIQNFAIWAEKKELNFCADSFDKYLDKFNELKFNDNDDILTYVKTEIKGVEREQNKLAEIHEKDKKNFPSEQFAINSEILIKLDGIIKFINRN